MGRFINSGKLVLGVAAMCLVLLPAVAHADYSGGSSDIERVAGYFSGSGGEFTMDSPLLSNSAYSPKTRGQDGSVTSFQAFCVELLEFTGKVDVVVSTTFIDELTGVVTGAGSHAIRGGKTYGDNLDAATAYLYTQFATGVLSDYDYNAAATRSTSAGQLQNAIWNLEEGLAIGAASQAQKWVDEATAAIDDGDWSGIGNVRILNNYQVGHAGHVTHADHRRQDQLYLIPVPASVLMGLPMLGLLGLVGLLRRKP